MGKEDLRLDESGRPVEEDGGHRLPGWVYGLLLALLVVILLGVESILNWLLP
ncbi:hypothetical protein [Symbiobacterium thermophilum]|uniref:Uncharacterized protein n=1 Tax=Symbiobacterium thermophilum (strain DSM 24528 / JCM 14929 / IAM 14863 / T) TaxID=292459 RepID=Q67PF2_SYMTH|nr:hypothetical protein [Symbiobacterium thermophilum]BAD40441.1 hypothetical protein STH1456 [Symbiobacterium thermophilum IAM 14863]